MILDDLYFNITMKLYDNTIFIKCLNDIYNNYTMNIKNNDNISIYSTSSGCKKGSIVWYTPADLFTNYSHIIVEIQVNGDNIITKETFRIKNTGGNIIKPVALKIINEVGIGDFIHATPIIRKLYHIYQQKITIICSNIYKEFIDGNKYINEFIDIENYVDVDKYEIFDIFTDWSNSYYYMDLKQMCAAGANISLKDSEMECDYLPVKYIDIPDLPEHYVCINPCIREIDRSWEKEEWQLLVDMLNGRGIYVVSIGKKNGDHTPYHNLDIKLGLDLAGQDIQNNLSQTWHIIDKSDLFVSFDTGIYIFASTTDVNILMLGWYGDPYYHQAVRKGDRNYKFHTVRGDCDIYCLTDPIIDVDTHGTIKMRHLVWTCALNKNFQCKPTPEQTFYKIVDINNEFKKLKKINMEINNVDFGKNNESFISMIKDECLTRKIYEKYFQVEENDIVVDIGASIGPFILSILDKKPKHCWAIEPLYDNFKAMYNNLKGNPVSLLRMAITGSLLSKTDISWDNGDREIVNNMTFDEFIKYYCIDKIDFLKLDCEGYEYDIFINDNIEYIKNNIKKMTIEFHLRTKINKHKFKFFRDNILNNFPNHEVNSTDGVDIKWDLYNDHFIEYYNEVLIYIDNR